MAFNNVPVNGWPQIKQLAEMDKIAQQMADMPTFTSNDKAFLADLPAYPDTDGKKVLTATTNEGTTSLSYEDIPAELPEDPTEDGTKVLTATTTSGTTVLSWETPSGGFNLPMPCAYGGNSGIGSASNEKNYWIGIWQSSGHEIPAISAGSNCTVRKITDNLIGEDAFSLYEITKTNPGSSASVNNSHVDGSGICGMSDYYNLGEFTKNTALAGSLQITTNKPILLALQSAQSSAIYNIVSAVTKGVDNRVLRCQYSNYDNGELHVVFPEDGEIDLTFAHNTSYAYAEIIESE